MALVLMPTVTVQNLTHPSLFPNFLAGDTYQFTLQGAANQPVYEIENSGPMTQVGQTDGNGNFVMSGVEDTGRIGDYTQLWFIGSDQASPALTFIVDQLSGGGSVTGTSVGQTSDGSVTGISSISISNGTVSTYSVNELDYNASLYYDAQTVGTLFENGNQI